MQESDTGTLARSFTPRAAPKVNIHAPMGVEPEEWQCFLDAMPKPLPSAWDGPAVDRQFGLWRERRAYDERQRRSHAEDAQRQAKERAANPPPPTDSQRLATLEAQLIELRVRVAELESHRPKPPARVSRIARSPSSPEAA